MPADHPTPAHLAALAALPEEARRAMAACHGDGYLIWPADHDHAQPVGVRRSPGAGMLRPGYCFIPSNPLEIARVTAELMGRREYGIDARAGRFTAWADDVLEDDRAFVADTDAHLAALALLGLAVGGAESGDLLGGGHD